mmetsp:Transcript_139682/g.257123  ORF Transcript_139682/g.257123 Transcript_139682/m.257123 type:complete len:303 (-) Transcript_139682:2431-3339(-)
MVETFFLLSPSPSSCSTKCVKSCFVRMSTYIALMAKGLLMTESSSPVLRVKAFLKALMRHSAVAGLNFRLSETSFFIISSASVICPSFGMNASLLMAKAFERTLSLMLASSAAPLCSSYLTFPSMLACSFASSCAFVRMSAGKKSVTITLSEVSATHSWKAALARNFSIMLTLHKSMSNTILGLPSIMSWSANSFVMPVSAALTSSTSCPQKETWSSSVCQAVSSASPLTNICTMACITMSINLSSMPTRWFFMVIRLLQLILIIMMIPRSAIASGIRFGSIIAPMMTQRTLTQRYKTIMNI